MYNDECDPNRFPHRAARDDEPLAPYAVWCNVIEVVKLEYRDGELACDRDEPTHVSVVLEDDRK